MIDYVDQSYKELVLTLSKEQIQKVNILKSKNFNINDFNIKLSIIGASHCLDINNEFFEVFAATKINNKALLSEKLNEIKEISYNFDNFNYNFKLVDKLEIDNYDLEFNYIFPGDNNPETKILLKKQDKNIIVNTLHFYPNEKTTIFTETNIEVL